MVYEYGKGNNAARVHLTKNMSNYLYSCGYNTPLRPQGADDEESLAFSIIIETKEVSSDVRQHHNL